MLINSHDEYRSPAAIAVRRVLSIGLLTPALAIALTGCGPGASAPPAEFRIPVEVSTVETGDIEELIVTTGTLRTREMVTLEIEVPGYLHIGRDESGIRLAEGSAVKAGQVIAEVTGEDARLHARIESTRRALQTAESELDRRRDLFASRLIAEEELRNAEVQYENALYEYERSKLNAAKSRITTPIGGVILRLARNGEGLPIADGQLVAPGFTVARIAPLEELIADIDLVGPELGRVHEGLAARIRHYAFEDVDIAAVVIRLAPLVDADTHTFRAEVAVVNQEGLLRPGMFVEVTIVAEQRLEVPVVPRESVVRRGGRNVVFVLAGQRVARRDVNLGLGDDDQVEVLAGLAPGDRIVVRGVETLTDGTRIRIVGS
ncbi:MAG: efflux RND transporter periplasmic adaptor subunit [Gammaproteobacteria bacterium]|nr:efflux RND transporter periplasmic adaptor subunit [Gammaproteobacteria bacterium]